MLNSEITEDSDSFETPLTAGPEKYKKVQKIAEEFKRKTNEEEEWELKTMKKRAERESSKFQRNRKKNVNDNNINFRIITNLKLIFL